MSYLYGNHKSERDIVYYCSNVERTSAIDYLGVPVAKADFLTLSEVVGLFLHEYIYIYIFHSTDSLGLC